MGSESYLMIHKGSLAAVGTIAEVEDTIEWVHTIHKRMLRIFASRATATGRPRAITERQLATRWERKDWWIGSDEAYELGLVDEVLGVGSGV
jgi:ATP-dependent protease ClpP protease subunit